MKKQQKVLTGIDKLDNHTKKELFYCSILIWVTFSLMLIVRFMNVLLFHLSVDMSQSSINNVITAIEANPVAQLILSLGNLSYIIQFGVIPAALMTLYYMLRKRVITQRIGVDNLSLYVVFAFFVMIVNFINDSAVLLGFLIR